MHNTHHLVRVFGVHAGLNENSKGDVDGDGTADLWRVIYHKQIKGAAITKVTWGSARHLLAVAQNVPNLSKVQGVNLCMVNCIRGCTGPSICV